jgi:hypothetical protein
MSSEILATAVSQYRNAYIQAIMNKSDAYLAAHFARLILSGLPPEDPNEIREDGYDTLKEPEVPKGFNEWTDDPDGNKYLKESLDYSKKLMEFAEQKQAKAVYDTLARYKT